MERGAPPALSLPAVWARRIGAVADARGFPCALQVWPFELAVDGRFEALETVSYTREHRKGCGNRHTRYLFERVNAAHASAAELSGPATEHAHDEAANTAGACEPPPSRA